MNNLSITRSLTTFISRIGRFCGWLLLALVMTQFLVVLARYLFSTNYLWAQEAALYLHSAIFMLAAASTLLANRHVRIDVLSDWLGGRGRIRVDRIGTLVLLISMMGVILFSSFGYVVESWSVLEGSPEISGLPGRYLLKTLMPVFAMLMLIAGLVGLFRRKQKT